jgi:hypothetical protein
MSPARRRKLQARAAETIADEKSLRDLRQALALTEERITRALKERLKARGVRYQRFDLPLFENLIIRYKSGLAEGNINFGVAAGCGRVNHDGYSFKVQSDT